MLPSVFVAICTAQPLASRRKAQREHLWKKQPEVSYLYFVGGGELSEECKEEQEEYGDLVCFPCEDGYEWLSTKCLLMLKWYLENREESYYYKCDDDTFVIVKRLQEFLCSGVKAACNRWLWELRGIPQGGAGYVMSQKVASLFRDEISPFPPTPEDEWFGKKWKQQGVKVELSGKLSNNYDLLPSKTKNNQISCHWIPERYFPIIEAVWEEKTVAIKARLSPPNGLSAHGMFFSSGEYLTAGPFCGGVWGIKKETLMLQNGEEIYLFGKEGNSFVREDYSISFDPDTEEGAAFLSLSNLSVGAGFQPRTSS